MRKSSLQLMFGGVLVGCGALLVFDSSLVTAMAECTPCTAQPACDNCPTYPDEHGAKCSAAVETYESSALTGVCDDSDMFECHDDTCSGSGTTGWTGASCTAGVEGDVCRRITVKKDKHKWQADCPQGLNCPCKAKFLDDIDGCQCVVVCGA